jgi:hypothetical protein
MRNFGSKQKRFSGASENVQISTAASSPDQIALVWNGGKEVIVVSPLLNESTNSYDIDFAKLPANLNIAATLDLRRKSQPNMPPISGRTLFLTAVPDYSERTRILPLNGNILAFRDAELTDWLINAEREMYLGTDNHPVFETALDDTACFATRLANGQVSLTEVPRPHVESTQDRIYAMVGDGAHNLVIETPLRCVARYFLTSQPEGDEILRPEKEKEATAVLLISGAGFSYGLWSPACGLFSEYAFPAPVEIKTLLARKRLNQSPNVPSPEEQQEKHLLDLYIRQAFDQLFLQLSPEKLEQMELSNYAQAVWAAEPDLSEVVDRVATDYSSKTGLEFIAIQAPLGEAVAGGLLLGSFTFGDDRVVGAEIVPPINLARDLLVMADKEEIKRQQQQEVSIRRQQSRAVVALWAAPVLTLAVILGLVFDLFRTQVMLGIRDVRADSRALELKPAVERRKSYEANLKWYQEFIKQVSALRRQQPVGTNLLYELNSNYPLTIDESFYISEMKLAVTGGVEIKGLARNKDAITSFLRSLEFAGGSESGKKLFSNLTYEVREGVDLATTSGGQAQLPTMAGSTLQGTNPAPGVIAWSIRGNYQPALEFAPPDPNKKPAPNAPPGNTNPGQPPANTAPAANANVAK